LALAIKPAKALIPGGSSASEHPFVDAVAEPGETPRIEMLE
jgi:hypothetical protein